MNTSELTRASHMGTCAGCTGSCNQCNPKSIKAATGWICPACGGGNAPFAASCPCVSRAGYSYRNPDFTYQPNTTLPSFTTTWGSFGSDLSGRDGRPMWVRELDSSAHYLT